MEKINLFRTQQRLKAIQDYYGLQLSLKGRPEERGFLSKLYHTIGLRHLALFLVIIVYALIGGAIFQAIEGPAETEAKLATEAKMQKEAQELAKSIVRVLSHPLRTDPTCFVKDATLEHEIIKKIKDHHENLELAPSHKPNWDFWGSVFFVGTIFTTIGYGHYAPRTREGRIATIIYAIIGIPLLLAALNDVGKLLTRGLKIPYTFLRRLINRMAYRMRQRKKDTTKTDANTSLEDGCEDGKILTHELLSDMPQEDAEEFNFPIPVVIIMLILWICISAQIFRFWEDWDYFTAFYFFFISLSTIGLGDVIPEHTKFTMMAFPLVMFGLSLLSMAINLIQIKMEEMRAKALEQQTIVGHDSDNMPHISFEPYNLTEIDKILEEQMGWENQTTSSVEEDDHLEAGIPEQPKKSEGVTSHSFKPTLGILQGSNRRLVWSGKRLPGKIGANLSNIVKPCRKRRGVQTDESFIKQMKLEEQNKNRVDVQEQSIKFIESEEQTVQDTHQPDS